MAVSSNKLQSAHLTQMHSLSQTDALILKDAKYIAEQQEELMLEAAGGDASKVLGCLMDGPPANRLAMNILENKYPT